MVLVSVLKNFLLVRNVSKYNSIISISRDPKISYCSSIYLYELIKLHSRSSHNFAPTTNSKNNNDVDLIDISGKQIDILKSNRLTKDDAITSSDVSWMNESELDVLKPCEEDVSDICPFTSPSFNIAAYVNKSRTLQELVKMGVDLSKLEVRKGAVECILKLDFDKHIKGHLTFLHDNGLTADEFGKFVTKNPFIFEQELDDLQVRINYLEAKNFIPSEISRIITANPFWLNFSTIEIDKCLGFFQRTFVMSGSEVRRLATKRPKLITYDTRKVLVSLFAVKEDMGFNEKEAKALLLTKPKIYDISKKALLERFDYVHNIMEISHGQILKQPGILLFRNYIVKERHEFLKEIGKDQYNPKLPGYVSLETLVHGSDVDFCKNVAKTSVDVFNNYLKTR